MPTLNLKVAPLQSPARYAALANALTRITVQQLGKRGQVTALVIEDLPAARWFVGGEPVQRPTAQLEITVTAGTNTAEQKAAFIDAAFTELQRQLGQQGALEHASYVKVLELPATDWGFGGLSQHERSQVRTQARTQARSLAVDADQAK